MTYLFIDGGYLRTSFKDCMSRYHSEEVDCSIRATTNALHQLHALSAIPEKMFYYDCVDERRDGNESDEQLARRVKAQEDRFNLIRDAPGWHVREGRLVGARKGVRQRQKPVDILLAVEMLSHAFNKNMHEAILIAGDDDFTPLVEELLRHGTYVQVLSDRRSGSLHLMHTADVGRRMGYPFYWHLTPIGFQKEHPLPDDASVAFNVDGGRRVEYGICEAGEKVEIFESGGVFHFCVPRERNMVSKVRARDLRMLRAYLEYEFSERNLLPEEWKPFNSATHALE